MRLMLVAALLLLQEPSPVPDLLKKIDGNDPAACFRAIADLADLGPERRAEIEKGAASLPAFYRDALLEELKIAKGAAPRVTLDGEARTAEAHIEKIAAQAGLKLEWDQRRPDQNPNPPFVADIKDVPAFEAIAGMIVRRRLDCHVSANPRKAWLARESQQPMFGMGHRSAAIVNRYTIWSRRADFGGPPAWRLRLSFYGLTAHREKMIGWKWPRVVEAVADGGGVLTQEGEPDSAVLWSDEPHYSTVPSLMWGFWMHLKAPERVKKLERLKFVAVAVCAEEDGTIEVKTKVGGGAGKAAVHGLDASILEVTQEGQGRIRVLLRVKPATLSPMDLLIRPVTAEATVSGFEGGHTWVTEEIVNGAVEYAIMWAPAKAVEGDPVSVLEKVRLTLPVKVIERPVYVEFRDLPLE